MNQSVQYTRRAGGKRLRDASLNHRDDGRPLISIISVVRNGEAYLEQTIRSVLGRPSRDIEYIIIDGGSSDGTLDIIRRYEAKIDYWVSEPDRGIYDAMNKGIELATGTWMLFINAGDSLIDVDVLLDVIQSAPADADVVYGRHEECLGGGLTRIPGLTSIQYLWKGMAFSHQSMLVKTYHMKRLKFDLQNRISADYAFIYALFSEQRRFHPVDRVITRVLADGFSASNNLAQTREQWRIARRYSGRTAALDCYYVFTFARIACNNMLKAVLPKRLINYLRSR